MFTEIHHESLKVREAELRRVAARQRQVRIAVEAGRSREAQRGAERGDGRSAEEVPVGRRWGVRRGRRPSAAGSC